MLYPAGSCPAHVRSWPTHGIAEPWVREGVGMRGVLWVWVGGGWVWVCGVCVVCGCGCDVLVWVGVGCGVWVWVWVCVWAAGWVCGCVDA